MSSFFRATLFLLLTSIISSCSFYIGPIYVGPKCVDIYPEDIPMYPNAQDIVQEEPIIDRRTTYTWNFTTSDNPEDVWKFYMDEMTLKWNGVDMTVSTDEKELFLNKGCFFTHLSMTYTIIDNTTYKIKIQLFHEPRM